MKRLSSNLLIAGVLAGMLGWQLRPTVESSPPEIRYHASPPAARTAPRAVLSWLRSEPTVSARWSAPEELTRALRSGSAADRDRAFNVLLPNLVAVDPALAGHLALAWEPGALRDELLRQFIRRWAATDIGGVITWVTSLLKETDRQNAALAATAQVAQDDPAGALELAQLLHTGLDDGSLEHLAQIWTEENPREAVDWIVHRPSDGLRDRLLARIAWTRAQREPAEAAGLVLDHMPPGDARDEALIGVVRQWAGRDPGPASAWVAQFPAGTLQTRALAALGAGRQLR